MKKNEHTELQTTVSTSAKEIEKMKKDDTETESESSSSSNSSRSYRRKREKSKERNRSQYGSKIKSVNTDSHQIILVMNNKSITHHVTMGE